MGGGVRLVEIVCPRNRARVRSIAAAPGLCELWVCAGESGGEGVKAEMTLLAWIVVLVLHSLLSLVVMMCNCHLPQCLVHGSSQRLPCGCYFQLRGTRPELTRGNFARPPWPGSPPSRPGSYFSPLGAGFEDSDLTSATWVGVLVRCSPTGRIRPAFVGYRTAY